jgi:cytochrome P450
VYYVRALPPLLVLGTDTGFTMCISTFQPSGHALTTANSQRNIVPKIDIPRCWYVPTLSTSVYHRSRFPTGHETSSSALTWTLYALALLPHIQIKLRQQLLALPIPPPSHLPPGSENQYIPPDIPSAEHMHQILAHPYLDACIRESLRLYSPVTSTMRVATHDDVVPLLRPYTDVLGWVCDGIWLKEGDIVTVPLQAMNRCAEVWGPEAGVFWPERYLAAGGEGAMEKEESRSDVGGLRGLWGGILTFGSGRVVNGNRSCIGHRFAIDECVDLSLSFLLFLRFIRALVTDNALQDQDLPLHPPHHSRVLD